MTPKRKYRNTPTVVDGIRFDSKAEARHYGELKIREKLGEIHQLECHPKFSFDLNGHHICNYTADFAYFEHFTGDQLVGSRRVVVDVKSPPTAKKYKFILQKKLFRALHGFDITVVS